MSSRIAAMRSESIRVRRGLAIPLGEITLRTSRSSGPGGQHAQKTETRVEAIFDVDASATLDDGRRRASGPGWARSCVPSPRTSAARRATASSRSSGSPPRFGRASPRAPATADGADAGVEGAPSGRGASAAGRNGFADRPTRNSGAPSGLSAGVVGVYDRHAAVASRGSAGFLAVLGLVWAAAHALAHDVVAQPSGRHGAGHGRGLDSYLAYLPPRSRSA